MRVTGGATCAPSSHAREDCSRNSATVATPADVVQVAAPSDASQSGGDVVTP